MIIQTFILFIALFSCQEQKIKTKTASKPKVIKMVATKKLVSNFVGNYNGTHNNKEIFVTLKTVPRTSKISGILTMDGKEANITATETSATNCTGIITENDTKKRYNITAAIVNKKLHFNITFPEYNNQILALVLDRSTLTTSQGGNTIAIDSGGGTTTSSGSSGTSTKKNNRDRALVGKWRFTEVISSGSGQFYSSFSTDYFLQFNANGECRTWTGSSAGGSGNVSYEGSGNTNLEIAQWYTFGKNVVFVNSNTNKELSIPYFAEENRMMLKGSLNRVYQRIY
ncbi:hypothetical protein ACNQGO_03645 [Flavobacterium sp. ZT3P35]|uniref:hypothetical protein n=1 Tax=Flavobacterium sp. ZT3P35 TaxID=3401727 RepID=UPI003AB0BB99